MSWQFLLTFFVQQCETQGRIMTQMATHKKIDDFTMLDLFPISKSSSEFSRIPFFNLIQDFLEGDQTKVNQ